MTAWCYEWDPDKAASNLEKHEIDFADAVFALEDDSCITIPDESSPDEVRFISLGADSFQRLLVVVFTHRSENITIISARKATRRERIQYEAKL